MRTRLNHLVTFKCTPAFAVTASALISPIAFAQTCDPLEQDKILASDGSSYHHFGGAIATDGDIAVIGAKGEGKRASAGRAYVFRFDGNQWNEEAKLFASDRKQGDWFGYDVDISGDVVVIGAPDQDVEVGTAYVFRYSGSQWAEEARLTGFDAMELDGYARAVAISGDFVMVGSALDDNHNGINGGSVYVFHRSESGWNLFDKLLALDGTPQDQFGVAIDMWGDFAIIGAFYDDDRGRAAGSAYLYWFDGQHWSLLDKLLPPDPSSGTLFGGAVAISDDVAVVTARVSDDRNENTAAAYVYRRHGLTWSHESELFLWDAEVGDSFSASTSHDTCVIGSPSDDEMGRDAGAAHLFHFDGFEWIPQAKLLPIDGQAEDARGVSVSIARDSILMGMHNDSDRGDGAGAVAIFEHNCHCLDLVVENLITKEFATFAVSRGTPGSRSAVVWGMEGPPSRFANVDGWCAAFGFPVRLDGREFQIVASGLFDSNGSLVIERFVHAPPGLDLRFQAAEQGTCPDECMSNLAIVTVKK